MNKLALLLALALTSLLSFGCCCKDDQVLKKDGIYIDARIHSDYDRTYLDWIGTKAQPERVREYEELIQARMDHYVPDWPADGRAPIPDSWQGTTHTAIIQEATEQLDGFVSEISAGQLTTDDGREIDVTYVILDDVEYCIYAAQLFEVEEDPEGAGGLGGPGIGGADHGALDCPLEEAGTVIMDSRFWIYLILQRVELDEVPAP